MNLPTRLTITVTPEDVTQGHQDDCQWCPAALASTRALFDTIDAQAPDLSWHVEVLPPKVELVTEENTLLGRYFLSKALHTQITTFDQRGVFVPGTYRLRLVEGL